MSRPSELERNAMRPSRWVRFLRTFWPYQLWRFVVINVRMLAVIWKSHHAQRHAEPRQPEPAVPVRATG